ncbi:hypothetical protein APHAL10511_008171 [Amanita phalloides]|nr:hypothetical protein APHAL10511_008171 [Amanita phalloides]
MKTIQKRLYTVFPRVAGAAPSSSSSSSAVVSQPPSPPPRARSSSFSSSCRPFHTASSSVSPLNFFDSPPPTSSRPSIPSPTRLSIETKPAKFETPPPTPQSQSTQSNTSHGPLSLGASQPLSNDGHTLVGNPHGSTGHHALFSYSAPNFYPATLPTALDPPQHVQAKKQRPKYQLFVGAYGIPKKCSASGISSSSRKRGMPTRMQSGEEDMGLAVQVGEDAYFVRDNAMGVADGVGGWARMRPKEIPLRSAGAKAQPTPSALFARRLMHFCSAEVDTVSKTIPISPASPARPQFSFAYSNPRFTPTPILASHAPSWHWSDNSTPAFLSAPFLSSSLPSNFTFPPLNTEQPISELEQDLEDSLEELSDGIDVLQILESAYDRTLKAHVVAAPESSLDASRSPSPARSIPNQPMDRPGRPSNLKAEMVPLMSGSSTALLAVLDQVPRQITNDTSQYPSISTTNLEAEDGYDAVIKIAHVGDCMGMLVRREEIAWRSEEMWWDFNTPVQLGPSTPTTPRKSAHVFTLPVRADDILILASDGLSDNLWDEDVLDEVVRFRRNFLADSDSSSPLTAAERMMRRRTLAGMLSEALCSRARRVSERRQAEFLELEDEVPFARRAREAGKDFRGGKNDDISVIVAVISPAADLAIL